MSEDQELAEATKKKIAELETSVERYCARNGRALRESVTFAELANIERECGTVLCEPRTEREPKTATSDTPARKRSARKRSR
jgi:hypothetical protein